MGTKQLGCWSDYDMSCFERRKEPESDWFYVSVSMNSQPLCPGLNSGVYRLSTGRRRPILKS